jgi:NADPH:quinone reductase-like Zn-dependent oxidoreductase
MRALQYDAYGPVERLTLRNVPSPRPAAGPLVRVTVAALNPKDALFRKGKFKVLSGRRFPKNCGVDFAGVVEAPYGDLRVGDAVFGALSESRYARGTLAELVAPRAAEVARIPAGVAEVDAAAVALVGLTALQARRGACPSRRLGAHQRRVGRRWHRRCADRPHLGRARHHRLERCDGGAVPFTRRGRDSRLPTARRCARRRPL